MLHLNLLEMNFCGGIILIIQIRVSINLCGLHCSIVDYYLIEYTVTTREELDDLILKQQTFYQTVCFNLSDILLTLTVQIHIWLTHFFFKLYKPL